MSAPHRFAMEAQDFKYGFLAAAISSILAKPNGEKVDERSLEQLRKGVAFMKEIQAGADLFTKEEAGGMASPDSVQLLSYALRPMAALWKSGQTPAKKGMPSEQFLLMAASINKVIESGEIPQGKHPYLQLTKRFFDSLSETCVSSLGTMSQPRVNAT